MADTIVNNTPAPSSDSGAAGWMVAIIVLVAVIAGGIYLYRHGYGRPAPSTTNIQVTVPNPLDNGGAQNGGGATQ